MIERFKIVGQYILPKHLLSRLTGRFAAARAGWFTQVAIRAFIRNFSVDMSEAASPDPKSYKTFNDFFTRPLKEGARPLLAEGNQLAHPVDGTVSQAGPIHAGTIVQAKNHDYSVAALLGGDQALAAEFDGGEFATIYLAPRDYHRIHMPCDGVLREMIYIPGDLFSVNPLTAQHVPNLFARNERVVAVFDTEQGPFTIVLVGATIVASIETVWAGTVTPPRGPGIHRWSYPKEGVNAVTLKRGEEMGRFKLGSTIVMTFPKDTVKWENDLVPGQTTRMGTVLGQWDS
ncbi:phosphatidylserine decarboxylase [Aliidiomarina taiwanensis]|uniref:Phosphatidylserine decarboxylase proenzyme n=1 Tax=Aliidiomarina taiwanensis TaxID=946228 RepID=A0A432WYZ8_9GAMM|nr:phosphatidylserine decarboxylase [Aliidiomarina taiwanensis]